MYRIAAIVAAFFIIGGNLVSPVASSPSMANYESVIGTIDDSLVLDADTAIDDQTTKHPQRRLYQPRRYKSIDDSSFDENLTKGPARFRFYAAWIAGYRGGNMGGGSGAGGKR